MSTETLLPATLETPLAEVKALTAKEKARLKEERRTPRPEDRHKRRNLVKLKQAIAERMVQYQEDGLTAIHAIATLDEKKWTKNSMLGQLKLQAARLLAFPDGGNAGPGDSMAAMLQQLNTEFHHAAPRIKSIRRETVTFEDAPPGGNIIESSPSAPPA